MRGSNRVTDQDPEGKYEALQKYGRDLTVAAREGKLDPVRGHTPHHLFARLLCLRLPWHETKCETALPCLCCCAVRAASLCSKHPGRLVPEACLLNVSHLAEREHLAGIGLRS